MERYKTWMSERGYESPVQEEEKEGDKSKAIFTIYRGPRT